MKHQQNLPFAEWASWKVEESRRSKRFRSRKLKREQKKRGKRRGRGKRKPFSPSPPLSFLVFALVPTVSTSSLGTARYAGQKRSTHSHVFTILNYFQRQFLDEKNSDLLCERFEPRSHLKSRLSLIVRVNVVLNRTVVVDSDWHFDNLCGSHLQSQSELYHVT